MKRLLLVNLDECPENLHFQQAFIRNASKRGDRLDIIHGFHASYSFMSPEKNLLGRVARVSTAEEAAFFTRGARYDAAVFLDLPMRDRMTLPFIGTLLNRDIGRKLLVENHFCPMPGQSRTADVMRAKNLFPLFDMVHVFAFDSPERWAAMGVRPQALRPRDYCVDCVYYTAPRRKPKADYVFSAGSAGRSFDELCEAARSRGARLRLMTNTPVSVPADLAGRIEVFPFNKNLHRLKEFLFDSMLTVVPVRDDHLNPTAGMAMAFLGMSLGRPVLCRDTEWMRRYVADGKNGLLYRSLNADVIADAIGRVQKMTPQRLAALGRAARSTILKKASLDVSLAAYFREAIDR